MGLEMPSYYETGPKNLSEVNKYLLMLDKKIGGVEGKETIYGIEFYKELAKKFREYGINEIKSDIENSNTFEQFGETALSRRVFYSNFFTEINGGVYKVNFINDTVDEEISGTVGFLFFSKDSNEIFINISLCESLFEKNKKLAKQYGRNDELSIDIYDFISGIIAHEGYHKQSHEKHEQEYAPNEEINADVIPLELVGVIYLMDRLEDVYKLIISADMSMLTDKYYNLFDDSHKELFERYSQILKYVIKQSGKEVEFEDAKNIILDRVKTHWIGIDGKKEEKFIERDGEKIRQGYYYDVNGEFKREEYNDDIHRVFASVLTPDILKQIVTEYKRLSKVE